MKRFIQALLLLCSTVPSIAQKKLPSYGKLDKADLAMTKCDFDPDAAAMVLAKSGELTYERGTTNTFKIKIERRVRIKVLKQNGLDEANVKLSFYSKNDYEKVYDVKGITYNADAAGNVVTTKLDDKNIYKNKLDNKYSQVVFSMPDVKVGSVIEYKYTLERNSMSNLDNWYFQSDLPTRISQLYMAVPEYFEYTHQAFRVQPMDVKESTNPKVMAVDGGTIRYNVLEKTFTMENLPGVHIEPYMTTPRDYMQRVQFQVSAYIVNNIRTDITNSWEKLIKELRDDEEFYTQLQKNLPTDDLDVKLKTVSDPYAKMSMIYDYVRNNMEFNGAETFWSSDGIKSAWGKHKGTSGDINLALINLLKSAHLQVYPLLVSSRDHGFINKYFPFLFQFNNVLAYVTIGDKYYILDATDKYNPAWLVPFDYMNTEGFVVNETFGDWVLIDNPKYNYRQFSLINGTIDEEGNMKGEAKVLSYNYARNTRKKSWLTNKDKFSNYFTSTSYPTMKINDIDVANTDNDSLALEQSFKFETALNSSGEYRYFNTNLFQSFEKNPFTADSRASDIDFGYLQSYRLTGTFTIPKGYDFEEMPKSMRMIMPDTSIIVSRFIEKKDDKVNIQCSIDFKKTFYAADDYLYLKEFYTRLYAVLNEQIVIHKKP